MTAPETRALTPVALLDGKLTMEMQDGFAPDEGKATKQVIAAWKARKSDAWGAVSRGTHGLQPPEVGDYLSRKVEEYSKGLSWLPRLTWLKKEMVTIHGRKWADLRFIGQRDNAKGPMDGLLYTRILATSYNGQLLEILFTSNTDKDPATKAKIDRIFESVKLEE
jgi:hypothetical protein